jgi:hypothetical protein
VAVACRWVSGKGDRAGDRICPDIRLVMGTGNLTGNTTTGRPGYPVFPTVGGLIVRLKPYILKARLGDSSLDI